MRERNHGWWCIAWTYCDDEGFKKASRLSKEAFLYVFVLLQEKSKIGNIELPCEISLTLGLACIFIGLLDEFIFIQ